MAFTFSKPTGYLDWGYSGGATAIVTPSTSQISQGWSGGQKPPANYFNWWQSLAGNWSRYSDERLDGVMGATMSLRGAYLGFTANNGASLAPGALFVSATGFGGTGPSGPQVARGAFSLDLVPLMMANVDQGGSLIAGFNCRGATQTISGSYFVRLPKKVVAGRTIISALGTQNANQLGASVDIITDPGNQIAVSTRSPTGAAQSNSFSLVVYEI